MNATISSTVNSIHAVAYQRVTAIREAAAAVRAAGETSLPEAIADLAAACQDAVARFRKADLAVETLLANLLATITATTDNAESNSSLSEEPHQDQSNAQTSPNGRHTDSCPHAETARTETVQPETAQPKPTTPVDDPSPETVPAVPMEKDDAGLIPPRKVMPDRKPGRKPGRKKTSPVDSSVLLVNGMKRGGKKR